MKTKEDIIFQLLLSLNHGDTGYIDKRVEYAIMQYNQLIEKVIKNEATEVKNTNGGNIDE